MRIKIMTERKYEERSFFQVAWEWEDVLFEFFNKIEKCECQYDYVRATKFKPFQYLYKFIIPKYQIPIRKTKADDYELYFPLRVWHCNQYLNKHLIPVFLDAYEEDVPIIIKMTKNLPFYFVTAYDTYEQIKNVDANNNVKYMPLSIADKWVLNEMPEKDIDVVQVGRRSEYLHDFMMRYCEAHPEVNYVYLESKGSWEYISTTKGNIGRLDSREQFMRILQKSKVSLVSTPGIETGRFGNIDFFTPRFFESAASYCHMIGHYTDNKEAKLLNINSVCPNVFTYEDFSYYLDIYLNEKDFKGEEALKRFVENNKTSKRAEQIEKITNQCIRDLI